MAIFQPAREKSSKVASCKLPLGIPSFRRFIGGSPARTLWLDQTTASPRYERTRFPRAVEKSNCDSLRGTPRVPTARHAKARHRRRSRCESQVHAKRDRSIRLFSTDGCGIG